MSYFIKNVEYGITGGPFDETVIASVEFQVNEETKFLSIVDLNGIFEFYLSDNDIYEKLINEEYEDLEDNIISEYNGISLDSLDDIIDNNDDSLLLIKYALLVLRLDEEETNELINKTTNKYLTKEDIQNYNFEEIL